jgi:hypothetical protein
LCDQGEHADEEKIEDDKEGHGEDPGRLSILSPNF